MRRSRSHFRRHARSGITADMTALVDMVFILLIFFLLSSSFIQPVMDIALPAASGEQLPDLAPPVVVAIDRNGQLFINSSAVDDAIFKERLASFKAKLLQAPLLLRVDKRVPFERFINVMDMCRALSVTNVVIEHD